MPEIQGENGTLVVRLANEIDFKKEAGVSQSFLATEVSGQTLNLSFVDDEAFLSQK